MRAFYLLSAIFLLGTGCHNRGEGHDAVAEMATFVLQPTEAIHLIGDEAGWAGEVVGGTLTWHSARHGKPAEVPVTRFAGRNGISYSGRLNDQALELAVSQTSCRAGGDVRRYALALTIQLGGQVLRGCGWSASHPSHSATLR